jgi:ElaB/YqjD/DUF883 family membrane-anchored ribosome-binding protein
MANENETPATEPSTLETLKQTALREAKDLADTRDELVDSMNKVEDRLEPLYEKTADFVERAYDKTTDAVGDAYTKTKNRIKDIFDGDDDKNPQPTDKAN